MHAEQAWKKRIDGRFVGGFLDSASDRLICKIYRERRLRAIWCLHENGRTAWEWQFDDEAADRHFIYANSVYLDGTSARRLNINTGEIEVQREFADAVHARPPISRGPVYEGTKSLMGLHPETLETQWEFPNPNYMAHDKFLCSYDNGVMRFVDLETLKEREVGSGERLGGIHGHYRELWCQLNETERLAVSTVTGEVAWREVEDEGFHGLEIGDTTFAGDVAYCGGRALSAYDLRTGKVLWRQFVEGNPGRLRVEGGRVYAGTKGGLVYMLDAQTGEVLLSHALKVEPTAIAPLAPNRIVVGTYKVIYCLEVG
jgi:hypothetical protein